MVENTAKTTVSIGGVTVTRTVDVHDIGVVGEIQVGSTGEVPLLVSVAEVVPEGLTVEEAAFRPDARPDMGEVTPERLHAFRKSLAELSHDDEI